MVLNSNFLIIEELANAPYQIVNKCEGIRFSYAQVAGTKKGN